MCPLLVYDCRVKQIKLKITIQFFSLKNIQTIFSLSQQLQVAPPTGVCQRDHERRVFIVGAGGCCEASAGVQASLFQRQSFLFSGKILQHAGVMQLHFLQRVPERGLQQRAGMNISSGGMHAREVLLNLVLWFIITLKHHKSIKCISLYIQDCKSDRYIFIVLCYFSGNSITCLFLFH